MFLAIRNEYGNDYNGYRAIFLQILNQKDLSSALDSNLIYGERGWVLINWVFTKLGSWGFEFLIALLSLFQCIVLFKIIKEFVPKGFYWVSIFIFIFDPYLMLIQLSAIRQSFAISLVTLGIYWLSKDKIYVFILLAILASFIHTSALLTLPLIFVFFLRNIDNKIYYLGFLIVIFSSFLFFESYIFVVNQFVETNIEVYVKYINFNLENINTGLGFLILLFLYSFILFKDGLKSAENSLIIKFYLVSLFILPLSIVNSIASRQAFYFTTLSLIAYAVTANRITNLVLKSAFLITMIFYYLYMFFGFFTSPIWIKNYSVYRTIFQN